MKAEAGSRLHLGGIATCQMPPGGANLHPYELIELLAGCVRCYFETDSMLDNVWVPSSMSLRIEGMCLCSLCHEAGCQSDSK